GDCDHWYHILCNSIHHYHFPMIEWTNTARPPRGSHTAVLVSEIEQPMQQLRGGIPDPETARSHLQGESPLLHAPLPSVVPSSREATDASERSNHRSTPAGARRRARSRTSLTIPRAAWRRGWHHGGTIVAPCRWHNLRCARSMLRADAALSKLSRK